METEILEVVVGARGREAIERAAALLLEGKLVAFPTETVYGLGALALDAPAVSRIFEAKGRPAINPLIVHVLDAAQAREVVRSWDPRADELAAAFWPGPLTLILPKAADVPDEVTAGLPAVGVRAPSHPVARALLATTGVPVAAPSANRYMAVSPTTALHVEKSIGGRIDAILDGGATPIGIESTVLDLTGLVPLLLRPGAISRAELEGVVGRVDLLDQATKEGAPRPSPGMARRHYAPSVPVHVLPSDDLEARLSIAPRAAVGVIARSARPVQAHPDVWIQLPDDAKGYARQLYAALHTLDETKLAEILVESLPDSGEWDGLRDRLHRAGG